MYMYMYYLITDDPLPDGTLVWVPGTEYFGNRSSSLPSRSTRVSSKTETTPVDGWAQRPLWLVRSATHSTRSLPFHLLKSRSLTSTVDPWTASAPPQRVTEPGPSYGFVRVPALRAGVTKSSGVRRFLPNTTPSYKLFCLLNTHEIEPLSLMKEHDDLPL